MASHFQWASGESGRPRWRVAGLLFVGSAMLGATAMPARAQQYFNGAQTTPNGAINGGGGTWDNATTNWTNATGTVSSVYDGAPGTTTVFGASASSTLATGGNVNVAAIMQFTGAVQFRATADQSIYTIQGGPVVTASGGTTFDVSSVAAGSAPSAVISSDIFGLDGVTKIGNGTLVLSGNNSFGGLTITAGTVQVLTTNSAGGAAVLLNGGTFQAGGAGNLFINNDFSVAPAGGTIDNNGLVLTLSGTLSNSFGASVLQLTDSSGGSGKTVLAGSNSLPPRM